MRILIVKTSALGDIIHAFPALHYLRTKFPEATIDWVVEERFAELVACHPEVDTVIRFNRKKRLPKLRYDYLFDLQGNCKSALVTFQVRAKKKIGFGYKTVAEWPNLLVTRKRYNPPPGRNIREDYLYLVQAPFGDDQPAALGPLLNTDETFETACNAMVCPGSRWPSKQLPNKMLIEWCRRLPDARFLWVWGTEEERTLCLDLQAHFPGSEVAPKLSLPCLQHVMSRMDVVIAMDSLPLHLAGTTGVPTLSPFGPSSAKKYAPLQHNTSVQGQCPYGVAFDKRCPRLRSCSAPCMEAIQPPP